MIKRQDGDIVFVCDTCEEEFACPTDDFNMALGMAKREGWKAEKVGKDWVHGCARCGT